MAEYNGSIELISGLIQKNKADFPLMEANAVAFYEEVEQDGAIVTREIRLPDKLKEVGISDKDRQDIIKDAAEETFKDERFTNVEKDVSDNKTEIFAAEKGLKARMDVVESKIDQGDNKELKLQYEEKESMLYLYTGETLIKPNPDDESVVSNVITSTAVSGGGGSGASLNYRLVLKRLDDSDRLTFLHTDNPKINFLASLTDTTAEEGTNNLVSKNIKFKLTVTLSDGVKNSYYFEKLSNDKSDYDLTKALSNTNGLITGDHDVTLTASYTQDVEYGEETIPVTIQNTMSWSINITKMYLVANFDDTQVYTADKDFVVRVYGKLNKTIHYNFNGEKDWQIIENAVLSDQTYPIRIPKQPHGNYPMEVYLTAEVNGKTVKSESKYFDIMFADEGNNKPIIRAVVDSQKGQQYTNTPIRFSVYSPDTLLSPIVLAIDGKVDSTRDVTRAEQIWNFKPMDYGKKTLTITCGSTVRTIEIEVEKFPYNIESVKTGLALDFNPQGRTNQDSDYNVFHNNVYDTNGNEVPLTWTLSDNFDWVNGGWQVDEEGESYFCIKAGTSVDINYLLFNDDYTLTGPNQSKGNGKEFKIIFKTTNVANPKTTWLSCVAAPKIGDPLGLQMDTQHGYIKTSLESECLTVPYSEDDKIEFDINIVPMTYLDNKELDLTTKDIPMIITYEDGTPARPLALTNSQLTFKQQNAVPITIGSPYCDVHIYRMKAYSTFLSDKEILTNFIADASNAEKMIDRYTRNQIYDEEGKLTPEDLAKACPDLRIIKISAPRFTFDKGDKVLETTIQMIHRNGDPLYDNWTAFYGRHNGQGTSSNAYGYSGRNLELSLKEKETKRYLITKPEGVYNEDGELILFNTVVTGKQTFYDSADEETRVAYEDPSTIATVTTIPGTTIILGDGKTPAKKVSLTRDSVPTNYFNVKVNIASSEHANNALLQKRFDRYLPYTSLAAAKDPNVKNNMNFFNCVIFVQESDPDLTTHQEFNDTEYHFYSIGNIGDSKKTDDSRTNDSEDENEFCVEIMDWNRELSAFPKDTMVNAAAEKYIKKDKNGTITEYVFVTEDNLKEGILFEKNADGSYKVSTDDVLETGWIVTDPKGIYGENGQHFTTGQIYEEKYLNQKFYNSADASTREEVSVASTTLLRASKYYVDILEQDDFSEAYTYGWRYTLDDEDPELLAKCHAKWIEFYRFITKDLSYDDKRKDAEGNLLEDPKKIAAWKKEFEDWFILDAALYYYLFTLRYTMVDNRAKNSFWHYGKCLDGKYRFDFWDYDNDTAFGIDNTGKFTMEYGVEDHDVNEGGAAHFRAHNSTFFVRVADYFADELIDYFKNTLEQNSPQVFSSTSLINEFDNWQSEFPEELWRLDYERKYKRTYVGGYGPEWDNAVNPAQIKKSADPQFLTEMMNGKKKYHRRQFERNQDIYMSSKFFGSTVFNDYLKIRGGGDMNPDLYVVKPNGDITITPYLNMYVNAAVEHNGKYNHHVRVNAGESVTLKYPTNVLEFNYIYGASYLQSLGDLSAMYVRTAELQSGRRLKQITLGNPTPGYNNPNLDKVYVTSNNKLLEELDVRNMSNLGGDVPITAIPSLRKILAQGTKYQTVTFANRGLIEEAYLPATINTIVGRNLFFLTKLELEGYDRLQSLVLENTTGIDTLALVEAAKNLTTVRLTDIDWKLKDTDVLNRLLKCDGIGEDGLTAVNQSVLKGTVYVEYIRQSEIDAYAAAWPELTVNFNPDNKVKQYTVTFQNNDGSFLYSMLVDENTTLSDIHNPILNGIIATPTINDSEDGQYRYEYKEWKTLDGQPFNGTWITNKDIVFQATYESFVNTFSVKWYADTNINSTVLQTSTVEWGKNVTYDVNTHGIPTKIPGSNDNNVYLFEKWNYATTNVKQNLDVFPVWAISNPSTLGNKPTNELTAADIYGLKQLKRLSGDGNKFSTPGEVLTLQMGYMPSYDNLSKDKEIVLIDSTTEFNGSNYIDTGYKILETDSSFVLALDFEMGYSAGTLVGCAYRSDNGFKIQSTQAGMTPVFNYLNSSSVPEKVGYTAPTADRTHREICVIRKVKGDRNIYLYTNNRYSLDDIREIEIKNTSINDFTSVPNALSFGADITSDGPANFAKGKIHYAKLWLEDIGAEECKKICSWTYEKQEFEYVGKGLHYYEDSDASCQATFVAKNLLDELMLFNESVTLQTDPVAKQGYGPSEIRQWLQKKPFLGTALTWQQTISKVQIPMLFGYDSNNPNKFGEMYQENGKTPADYFYLPCVGDLDGSFLQPDKANSQYYERESKSKVNYPIFINNQSRLKTIGDTGIVYSYWSRSPSPSSSSTRMYGVVRENRDTNNKPAGSISDNYQILGEASNYYFNTYTNNLSSNYSKHGVLVVFSV